MAQTVKPLPAMQETRVQSLGWEDPLEKEMATHSSTLAWKIPWTEEPGRLQSMGSQRVGHDWACVCIYIYIYTHTHTLMSQFFYRDFYWFIFPFTDSEVLFIYKWYAVMPCISYFIDSRHVFYHILKLGFIL